MPKLLESGSSLLELKIELGKYEASKTLHLFHQDNLEKWIELFFESFLYLCI